jgi:phage shock protein C
MAASLDRRSSRAGCAKIIDMFRSRKHRIIAGVCGGIAERFNMSPTVVRLLALLSCILPGPQFVIYLILWIVIPKAPAGTP